ncbi:hypothetical protein ACTMSW_01190 [Micromonospora sp. BQ11]|uniref:hypothetical protein n=1 Tax=Micromonospora sp. BQ11 TaxID=3452212 RepID=UPI003F89FDD9
MSEHLTFERLHRELSGVRWPEAAELRARARRRSRRTTALAAAAVLVLASGSVAVAAGRPRDLVAPVAAGPSRAEIPLEALVPAPDLPEPAEPPLIQSGIEEPVRVDDMLMACLKDKGIAAEWVISRYSRSQTVPRSRQVGGPLLRQELYRIRPEVAGDVFDGLDRAIWACPTVRDTAMAEWRDQIVPVAIQRSWTVLDRDFAGDRSVVVRYRESPVPGERVAVAHAETLRAVVQVGDIVMVLAPAGYQLTVPTDFPPVLTRAELRALARTAAARLCVAVADLPC